MTRSTLKYEILRLLRLLIDIVSKIEELRKIKYIMMLLLYECSKSYSLYNNTAIYNISHNLFVRI